MNGHRNIFTLAHGAILLVTELAPSPEKVVTY